MPRKLSMPLLGASLFALHFLAGNAVEFGDAVTGRYKGKTSQQIEADRKAAYGKDWVLYNYFKHGRTAGNLIYDLFD
ncbi:MAG: hypothetical protein HY517_05020 [Candidatus Aenigmarchaeota archaeon]|nr:hypothetical protein [Candidatus Aenigmarchaeota archaeon]